MRGFSSVCEGAWLPISLWLKFSCPGLWVTLLGGGWDLSGVAMRTCLPVHLAHTPYRGQGEAGRGGSGCCHSAQRWSTSLFHLPRQAAGERAVLKARSGPEPVTLVVLWLLFPLGFFLIFQTWRLWGPSCRLRSLVRPQRQPVFGWGDMCVLFWPVAPAHACTHLPMAQESQAAAAPSWARVEAGQSWQWGRDRALLVHLFHG